eukprot:1142496-Pelagomonas_calceolata.AAC.7
MRVGAAEARSQAPAAAAAAGAAAVGAGAGRTRRQRTLCKARSMFDVPARGAGRVLWRRQGAARVLGSRAFGGGAGEGRSLSPGACCSQRCYKSVRAGLWRRCRPKKKVGPLGEGGGAAPHLPQQRALLLQGWQQLALLLQKQQQPALLLQGWQLLLLLLLQQPRASDVRAGCGRPPWQST